MTLPAVRGATPEAWRSGAWQRAAVTGAGPLVGVTLDAVLGDPRRGHPVFGAAADRVARRMVGPTRRTGPRYVALAAGVPTTRARRSLLRRAAARLAHRYQRNRVRP